MAFDAARYYGRYCALTFFSCLLATSLVGGWPLAAAAVALYYLLTFFNALERRDLLDERQARRRRLTRRRPKRS